MKGSRYLVTGAGGFIGYNLANQLAHRGHDVVGLDVEYPAEPGPGREAAFRMIRGDFRDGDLVRDALQEVDVVFHLASAHLQVSLDESEYWDVNVHSLPALLDAARAAEVARFVHCSSVGVYGRLASCPATEATPCHPQSIYGETKLAGERLVLEHAAQSALAAVALRPAWVFGPGCPRTAKIYRALRKRRFVMIGPGRNLRHPLFIDDFVAACLLAAHEDGIAGEPFIIAGAEPITSRELIEAFCRQLAVPRPPLRLPYPLGRLMAASLETGFGVVGREPPISRRTLEFFDTDNAFDITKAKEQLGFVPAVDIERGLDATRGWLESLVSSGQTPPVATSASA